VLEAVGLTEPAEPLESDVDVDDDVEENVSD